MQKLLFPWSWAVSPSIQMFLPTWKLQETLLLGLYRAPSHRHNQLLIPFSAPLPSVKNAERGFSMSSFSSWLDVPGDQSPSWSPPGVISLEQEIFLVILLFRKLKCSRSSVPETVCVCICVCVCVCVCVLYLYLIERQREKERKREKEEMVNLKLIFQPHRKYREQRKTLKCRKMKQSATSRLEDNL